LRPFFDATYGPLDDGANPYLRRGIFVGDAMDVLVTGGVISDDWQRWFDAHDDWVPFLDAGKKYLRENPPESIPIVQYRMIDKLQGFSGKPDWIFGSKGKRRIIDVKTGAVKPPDWLGMQTGAYAVLAHEEFGVQFTERGILWLKDNGDYEMIFHDNPHDGLDFLALLSAEWVARTRLR
jgi:hypothetical protein